MVHSVRKLLQADTGRFLQTHWCSTDSSALPALEVTLPVSLSFPKGSAQDYIKHCQE